MSDLSHMLSLDGYGTYVWPAYAFAAVVMIGLFIAARRQLVRAERDAERMRATLRTPERR
jgi:heme exporter protein CcmD